MSPLFVALPPADLPTVAAQPPALHTVELLAAKSTAGRHTVRSGDTVYEIAARYGVSPQAIVRANGLKDGGRWIMPGEVLTIPGKHAAVDASPKKSTTSSSSKPAAKSRSAGSITVRSGDTLSGLAVRHSTTVAAIARANNISASGFIYPGQRLVIAGSAAAPSAPAKNGSAPSRTSTPAKATGGSVTVRSGDTLSGIALRHGTTVSSLAAANGINAGSFIYPGQRLRLPGGATASPAPSAGSKPATRPTAPRTLDRPYDETNIGSYKSGEKVPDTFLHYTYSSGVARAAAANREYLATVDVPSRTEMKKLIVAAAKRHGVDSNLMLALSYQESGWNHRAVSPANAIGAMQVIPSSGQWASSLVGRQLNLLNPKDNAEAGVVIIKALLNSTSNRDHAIGGYYQGLGSVRQHGLFADTKNYVRNIKYIMTTL